MIFYNTADKRYTDLAFSALASFGAHAFLACVYSGVYTEVELQPGDGIIFDFIFNEFDNIKFNDVLERIEVYKPV